MELCSDNMIINLVLFLFGLVILIKGSDWFVEGASDLARRFNISEVVIGLTLVSLGTSMPEFATNVYASTNGEGGIALGNIVGSNISNILLILGVGALLFGKIKIQKVMFWRDGMCMMGMTLLCFLFCVFGKELNRIEGAILLLGMCAYGYYLFRHREVLEEETEGEVPERSFGSAAVAGGFSLLGLVMLTGGAKVMVDNVVWFSVKMQWDQAVIGSTVVALGTSLPELAVTVAGVIKKKHDIAMGNIIGSNFFNIGLILGISALICPIPVSGVMMTFNLPVMLGSGLLLLIFMRSGWRVVRAEGAVFLLGYVGFIVWNLINIKA